MEEVNITLLKLLNILYRSFGPFQTGTRQLNKILIAIRVVNFQFISRQKNNPFD